MHLDNSYEESISTVSKCINGSFPKDDHERAELAMSVAILKHNNIDIATKLQAELLEKHPEADSLATLIYSFSDEMLRDSQSKQKKSKLARGISEVNLSDSFVQKFYKEIKYSNEKKLFLFYNKQNWRFSQKGEIDYLIQRHVLETIGEQRSLLTRKAIQGIKDLLKSHPNISTSESEWDQDDFLLGTPNGYVDLRTGIHHPPDPSKQISLSTSIAPDKNVPIPKFKKFLNELTSEQQEVIKYLKVYFGYCLTGITDEQIILFLHGLGGNGKSVLLSIMKFILGDYAGTAPMSTFTQQKGTQHPTELMYLKGFRFITAAETNRNDRWNDSRLKDFSGGESNVARGMKKDFTKFQPKAKLVLSGNNLPSLDRCDDGIKRRLFIFHIRFIAQNKNKNIKNELIKEAPGILQWLIEGCLLWQNTDLKAPKAIKDYTDKYFQQENTFLQWFNECCMTAPANHFTSSISLYRSQKDYYQTIGEKIGTLTNLKRDLESLSLDIQHRHLRNRNGYYGIALKTDEVN